MDAAAVPAAAGVQPVPDPAAAGLRGPDHAAAVVGLAAVLRPAGAVAVTATPASGSAGSVAVPAADRSTGTVAAPGPHRWAQVEDAADPRGGRCGDRHRPDRRLPRH